MILKISKIHELYYLSDFELSFTITSYIRILEGFPVETEMSLNTIFSDSSQFQIAQWNK